MPSRDRLRDEVFGAPEPNLVEARQAEGWRMVAIEWERESAAAPTTPAIFDVPYGFRVASDCRHLEEDPVEGRVLRTVMQGVVNDRPLSHIADDLNRRGFRTRSGERWNPAKVFRLMPALVDSGPRIFSEADWPTTRRAQAV